MKFSVKFFVSLSAIKIKHTRAFRAPYSHSLGSLFSRWKVLFNIITATNASLLWFSLFHYFSCCPSPSCCCSFLAFRSRWPSAEGLPVLLKRRSSAALPRSRSRGLAARSSPPPARVYTVQCALTHTHAPESSPNSYAFRLQPIRMPLCVCCRLGTRTVKLKLHSSFWLCFHGPTDGAKIKALIWKY